MTTDQLREVEGRYAKQAYFIRGRLNYADNLDNIGRRFYNKVINNYAELTHATELARTT